MAGGWLFIHISFLLGWIYQEAVFYAMTLSKKIEGMLFCGLAASTSAWAQLTRDNRQLDFRPTIQETNVVARFTFSNVGNQPVTVTSVKSTCDCTTTRLDKKTYLPGEKGEIIANFKIGNRIGLQQKNIFVQTDDPSDPVSQLTLRVFIPELVKITPGFVFWKIGEDKTVKTITLKVAHDSPIKIIGVSSTNERLFPQLKTIKAGEEYVVTVTPSDTTEPAKATLRIESDFPKDKPRAFSAYAYIKDSNSEEKVPNASINSEEKPPNVSIKWKDK